MLIQIDMEIDTATGNYSIKFNNLSTPGQDIDVDVVSRMVKRVMDNVVLNKDKPKNKELITPNNTKILN